MMTNPTDPAAAIHRILAGIDADEVSNDEAWWTTSTGAEFGAGKLAEVQAFVTSYGDQREAAARADERERCVAWLRSNTRMRSFTQPPTHSDLARAIERGEHMKGSGGE